MVQENRYSATEAEKSAVIKANPVPPYLKRAGFRPSKIEDFGAFPEIHYAQYPLDMGRKKDWKPGGKNLPVIVNEHGEVRYDAIVRQGENAKKIIYSQHKDLIPKFVKESESDEDMDPDEKQKVINETVEETRAALEKIVNVRLSATQPRNVPTQSQEFKFINYKPSQQAAALTWVQRRGLLGWWRCPWTLWIHQSLNKRVPRASGSPPVPVMHSPRPVTVKDQQDWKIPPCISNWKNPKGYTIPLDKHLAADGRGFQEVQINDNFAKLSETLYVAEQKAREAVTMWSKAKSERNPGAVPAAAPVPSERDARNVDDMSVDYERARDLPKESREEREERLHREKIREEERGLEAKDAAMGKKSKITRDRDRDVSEKVALGMASTGASRREVMYDQRLFNQEKGMDSGFAVDDAYNVYDKGLFTAQPTLSTLYRPKKDADSECMEMERFKTDKAFTGTSERAGIRDGPVPFEKEEVEEADPFGLDQFLTEVKKWKKAMSNVGSGCTMKASAGSTRDGYETLSRTRIVLQCHWPGHYVPLLAASVLFVCISMKISQTPLTLQAVTLLFKL
ncbi:unnamed protein product [Withania somnifera]